MQSNFVICVNFEKLKIEEGKIQLKLRFESVQDTRLVVVWMPLVERTLIFDKNLDVQVE